MVTNRPMISPADILPSPDKWEAQSPCEQWTARDVVAHVVDGHRSVIAGVRGGESEPLGADEDPRRAWEEVAQAIDKITGDPEAVAKVVDGPALTAASKPLDTIR